ncbi:MAG: hypothetical protein J7J15_00655 [Candidatus Aenigmarchaeota archaeon]|nr:hypothetical protein [Candidatus Aenigmarchaeota archaeon]
MDNKKFKGVTPVISSILIIGVLAVITGIAYQQGIPMIQKHIDTTSLHKAEKFLRELDNSISDIARTGGTKELIFDLPGEIKIDPEKNTIEFSLKTSGSIYMRGGFICLNRNGNCNLNDGVWGKDSYSIIGAQTDLFDEYAVLTTYKIMYRKLIRGEGYNKKIYQLDIVTSKNVTVVGSKNSKILIEKIGEERGDIIKTIIKLDII